MQTIKSEIIIDGDTVIVNGETYDKRQTGKVEEPKEVHPFLKDVPTENEYAYTLSSSRVSAEIEQVFQVEIDRGTTSRSREALVELDRRRVALTALRKWIGENDIAVATEEQLADWNMPKFRFEFNYIEFCISISWWKSFRPVGDIHLLSQAHASKVRDNCDSLIRTAYGWPEVK